MKKIISLAKTIWRNDTVMSYIVWMVFSIIVSFAGAIESEMCTDEVTKLFATVAWLFGMLSFGMHIAYLENYYNRKLSKTVECYNDKEYEMLTQMHKNIGKSGIYVLIEPPNDKYQDAIMKHLFVGHKLDKPVETSYTAEGLDTTNIQSTVITVWTSVQK